MVHTVRSQRLSGRPDVRRYQRHGTVDGRQQDYREGEVSTCHIYAQSSSRSRARTRGAVSIREWQHRITSNSGCLRTNKGPRIPTYRQLGPLSTKARDVILLVRFLCQA
jgi:hypothetical protein